MRHTTLRTAGLLCAVLLATSTLSSCSGLGGDGGSGDKATTSSSRDSSDEGTPTESSESSESAESSQAPVQEELGEPVATRRTTIEGIKVTLQVYPVVRSGGTMVANLALTVDTSAEENLGLYDLFGDDQSDIGNADSAASVDGVKLVDTKNNKLYLAASDGDGACVCTNTFSGDSAEPGDVVNMSATYAAAPDDVTTVDVTVPQFGTINRVPVE